MEDYVILLVGCLPASLMLMMFVGRVVKKWREVRKEQADMKRLKAGSVWRMRSKMFRNNPFDEDARYFVTVQETKANSDGRMWVRYQHKWGLVETDPADMFVQMYIYVEGPVYATVEEVLRKEEEEIKS